MPPQQQLLQQIIDIRRKWEDAGVFVSDMQAEYDRIHICFEHLADWLRMGRQLPVATGPIFGDTTRNVGYPGQGLNDPPKKERYPINYVANSWLTGSLKYVIMTADIHGKDLTKWIMIQYKGANEERRWEFPTVPTPLPHTAVVVDPDSKIGEFTYGEFSGHAAREPARQSKWDPSTQSQLPARPAHWQVFVYGSEKAWREVVVPLKKGRRLTQAIALACQQFTSPADIQVINGQFGAIN